jgi:hypothetical protein
MRAALVLLVGVAAVLCLTGPAGAMPLRDPAAVAASSIVVTVPLPAAGTFAVEDVGIRVVARSANPGFRTGP